MVRVRYLVPLAIFVALAGFFYVGLGLNPRDVPSPLIDKAAPTFNLSQLSNPQQSVSRDANLGKVWLLNVWASWCVSCRQEHPVLMQLSRTGEVPIIGLNYKDTRKEAMNWLNDFGNPYNVVGFDSDGRVGTDYGVYGVPETYIIDKQGVIRHKVTGPITPDILRNEVLPLVRKLNG
jgi:cytochrome c biogenesis protein CcmG/thiol:disulfide interchange protein DsbE